MITLHQTHEAWASCRQSRNTVTTLVRDSKINYFQKLATSLQQGNLTSKQWLKITKQFLKQNNDIDITLIVHNGQNYSSFSDKANIINDYFSTQSTIDDTHATLPPFNPSDTELSDIVLSEQDVRDALKLIDVNKACGPDLVGPKLLKEGASVLSPYLCTIFNNSLSSSYFPSSWKTANIVPVHKKGDRTNTSNYRPISLISCISKVFEKCVFKHLHNYIVSNNKLTPVQSGFTPGDSALFQLADLCHTFSKAVDEGKEIRVVFCDISKVFDRVWHIDLLFKLRQMGISGHLLDWFRCYLDNRTQRVALEGCLSKHKLVNAGVPQGSILGSLLFLIYINDIVEEIGSNIRLFADDTSLYLIVQDPTTAAELMNADLETIYTWSQTWLVNFNPNKTEELIISRKAAPPAHPPLHMNNTQIKNVNSHKHLGLILNKTCSWHEHINEISSKAWKRINILRKLKYQLDRSTLQTIYFSFIRPILEYADIVWDSFTQYEKNELEKIQVEAAMIVTGATRSCSNKKILEEAGWDSLETRRYKHRLITFHKMVYQNAPQYLQSIVPPSVHQVSQRNLRYQRNIHIPRSRTNLYRDSFIPKTSKDWNNLPENVKQTQSLREFRKLLDRDNILVPNYYFFGIRKSQIMHVRFRLQCSSLEYDLYKNHISDNDLCTYCNTPETAKHYLLHCKKYNNVRAQSLSALNVAVNIDILCKGCPMYDDTTNRNIFSAVQEYIRLTKRFD